MTRDQKRIALAYLREIVIPDLVDRYEEDLSPRFENDQDRIAAMRAAVRVIRGVKVTKKERKR